MLRRGAFKKEILFVLFFVVILGGLTVLLTMRKEPPDNQSFAREELLGKNIPPRPTVVAPVVNSRPVVEGPLIVDMPRQDIPKDEQKATTTESGLKIIDQVIGGGEKVKVGSNVSIIYTGTLRNGNPVDSNVGQAPLPVTIGEGVVIRGWEEGLLGMKRGGKRKLIIPPNLAYGERGRPPKVPPNAELIFEVEAVGVVNK